MSNGELRFLRKVLMVGIILLVILEVSIPIESLGAFLNPAEHAAKRRAKLEALKDSKDAAFSGALLSAVNGGANFKEKEVIMDNLYGNKYKNLERNLEKSDTQLIEEEKKSAIYASLSLGVLIVGGCLYLRSINKRLDVGWGFRE
jgi:hypothetical protein